MTGLSSYASMLTDSPEVGVGWAQNLSVPAPAAGGGSIGRQAPGETWERWILARASYAADATVGSRILTAQILDGTGNVYWETPVASPVVASTVVSVNLAQGVTPILVATGVSVACLPDMVLPAGFSMRLLAAGVVGVADQWSALSIYAQRFPTDAVRNIAAG